MQLVLAHERYANQRSDAKSQHRISDAVERLNKGLQHAGIPPFRQVLQLIEIIADPANLPSRVGIVAEALPETGLEDVLVDGGADRDTKSRSKTSAEVCDMG